MRDDARFHFSASAIAPTLVATLLVCMLPLMRWSVRAKTICLTLYLALARGRFVGGICAPSERGKKFILSSVSRRIDPRGKTSPSLGEKNPEKVYTLTFVCDSHSNLCFAPAPKTSTGCDLVWELHTKVKV